MTISSSAPEADAGGEHRRARRSRWWLEALLILWLAWVYDLINDLTPLRHTSAYQHARAVMHLERWLHLDPEMYLNRWMVAHHTLAWLSATYYDTAHYLVTFTLVAVLWWRRPDVYRPLRTALALTNVAGFVVFLCYPMAPPRLIPDAHFVDVVVTSHALLSYHTGTLASAANELAAMPSLHMSWALWAALAFRAGFRDRWWSHLGWLHPAATVVAVLGTGNHFLADVVAGALVLVLATVVASWWYRHEPLARVPRPAWYLRMEQRRLDRSERRRRAKHGDSAPEPGSPPRRGRRPGRPSPSSSPSGNGRSASRSPHRARLRVSRRPR